MRDVMKCPLKSTGGSRRIAIYDFAGSSVRKELSPIAGITSIYNIEFWFEFTVRRKHIDDFKIRMRF